MANLEILLDRYEAIEDSGEKQLFDVSLLCLMPISMTKLLDFARKLGMRSPTGKLMYAQRLKGIIGHFEELGLWVQKENPLPYNSGGQFYGVPEALQEYLLPQLVRKAGFEENMKLIRQEFPFNITRSYGPFAFLSSARELFIADALDDQKALLRVLNIIYQSYPHELSEKELLSQLYGSAEKIQKIKGLTFEMQAMILGDLLSEALEKIEDLEKYRGILTDLIPLYPDGRGRTFLAYMVLLDIMQGNTRKLRHFLQEDVSASPFALNVQAWAHFVLGNLKESIQSYDKALKLLRKLSSNSTYNFHDASGIFYPFAIFKENVSKAYKSLGTLSNKSTYWFAHGIDSQVKAVLYARQNDFVQASAMLRKSPTHTFSILSYAWAVFLVDFSLLQPSVIGLMEVKYEQAWTHGYKWYVLELSAILAKISQSRRGPEHYRAIAQKLREELNLKAFVDEVEKNERWEIALEALSTLSSSKQKASAGSDKRIIWLVDFDKRLIQPKMQSLSKSGNWSAGRNVALKRLHEGDVEELSEQDKKIAKAIETYSYGYYGSVEYAFDMVKAFRAMVGHPLLFLHESPSVAVELLKDEAKLVLEETEAGYKLRFENMPSSSGVQVAKETPTRYILREFSENHQKLLQAMGGKDLHIPAEGKERLLSVIGRVSSLITVHSTIEEDNRHIRQVESDARPRMHILPIGDSYRMEMLVKPFYSHPPYFKPGEGRELIISEIDGEQLQTRRDLPKEKELADEIIESCSDLKYLNAGTWEWFLEDVEECLDVLLQLNPLREQEKILLEWPKGEKFRIAKSIDFNDLKLKVKRKSNWFELDGEIRINEKEVWSFQQLLQKAQQTDAQFVEMGDGQFLALTKELRRKLDEWQSLSSAHGKIQRIHPLQVAGFDDLDELLTSFQSDKAWRESLESLRKVWQQTFSLPTTFKAELRPYQEAGYQWLQRLAAWGGGACLADDMGLGKTIQALALLLEKADKGPSMVVAPASVVRNWRSESQRFCPTLNPIIFGPGDREEQIKELKPFDLLLVSYGLLPSEEERLCSVNFNVIILDEAQSIKNSSTKRSKVAMKLQADFRMILTGTPIENHLGELWNLFQFINPGLLGSDKSFADRFTVPIERDRDLQKKKHLKKLIQPFILRRRKSEVLDDLPEKTEISLTIDLSEEEMAFYEAMRRDAVDRIEAEKAFGQNNMQVLAEIMRLRQASCHPQLVKADVKIKSSKLEVLGELLEELIENNHKVLIFSQFVGHLSLIKAFIEKKNISYQYLDGQTPLNRREENVQAFQRGESSVFLISLKAGGTGLNLTAADYVIHMDPWWNPAVEDQASDRAHRIGQQRPVTVYRLIAANTIEEKIVKLHEHKRDLADSLLEGTEASARLTADDLVALIRES